ncbi:Uncharacterized conserved protein [Palleronia salina]|uniref:Uncharacterized conserved protein n=3 Tax=Roseobacteraceae TaxID=2854170 RepID=A0A1M6HG72_9RHOB|nr:Uncharacterized conserved protein [Palleronia pelagia]SHJ21124.1 Uncharacterized conserved protein [Palleronia salina]
MADGGHYVRDILDQLDELSGRDKISVGDVVEAFGPTAFLPLLLVPALLVTSPLSGIPLFSSLCGITIGLISSQLFIQRQSLWLPGFLWKRTVRGQRLHEGIVKSRSLADWVDRHLGDRLHAFTSAPGRAMAYLACMVAGFAMPFLELVPFSSSLLGLSVVFIVTGLLAVDGLFVLLGYCIIALASMIPVFVFTGLLSA